MTIIPIDETRKPPESLSQARESAFWETQPGPDIPEQVFKILQSNQHLIVVSRLGIYRIEMQQASTSKPAARSFLGLPTPTAFDEISPRGFRLTDNTTAEMTGDDHLLIYSSGTLTRMKLDSSRLQILAEVKLEGDGSEAALLAGNETYFIVARDNMPLLVLDAQLAPLAEIDLPRNEKPKQLCWIPGSNDLAIVTHSGILLRLDCSLKQFWKLDIPIRQKLTCLTWKNEQLAWLGIAPNQVSLVNMNSGEVLNALTPEPKTSEKFYFRFVAPLYRYNPKPSALNQSMQYLLTGSSTFDPQLITMKLDTAKVELEIWQPIVSNTIFVIVVLSISCLYLARKEY